MRRSRLVIVLIVVLWLIAGWFVLGVWRLNYFLNSSFRSIAPVQHLKSLPSPHPILSVTFVRALPS
jgi:hypothetical protein